MFLDLKAHIRKLDHETSDLKFLNNQYVHKMRALEKDSKAKTEHIQQLQEKNMQAVVQTPGRMAYSNHAYICFKMLLILPLVYLLLCSVVSFPLNTQAITTFGWFH